MTRCMTLYVVAALGCGGGSGSPGAPDAGRELTILEDDDGAAGGSSDGTDILLLMDRDGGAEELDASAGGYDAQLPLLVDGGVEEPADAGHDAAQDAAEPPPEPADTCESCGSHEDCLGTHICQWWRGEPFCLPVWSQTVGEPYCTDYGTMLSPTSIQRNPPDEDLLYCVPTTDSCEEWRFQAGL